MPAELAVADIKHAVVARAQIERRYPRGTVGVKQERQDITPQRMQRRLANLVGQAVTDFRPTTAGLDVAMIIIAVHAYRVVVVAVAVENNPATARNSAYQPGQIQVITGFQLR